MLELVDLEPEATIGISCKQESLGMSPEPEASDDAVELRAIDTVVHDYPFRRNEPTKNQH
ncbi:MAG TPA: hypothetical protein P5539_05440 [Mesotoga sp.]|nr:hypothetical protein [Mesotoga sp.]